MHGVSSSSERAWLCWAQTNLSLTLAHQQKPDLGGTQGSRRTNPKGAAQGVGLETPSQPAPNPQLHLPKKLWSPVNYMTPAYASFLNTAIFFFFQK